MRPLTDAAGLEMGALAEDAVPEPLKASEVLEARLTDSEDSEGGPAGMDSGALVASGGIAEPTSRALAFFSSSASFAAASFAAALPATAKAADFSG